MDADGRLTMVVERNFVVESCQTIDQYRHHFIYILLYTK
jgi:hypothetical protein